MVLNLICSPGKVELLHAVAACSLQSAVAVVAATVAFEVSDQYWKSHQQYGRFQELTEQFVRQLEKISGRCPGLTVENLSKYYTPHYCRFPN